MDTRYVYLQNSLNGLKILYIADSKKFFTQTQKKKRCIYIYSTCTSVWIEYMGANYMYTYIHNYMYINKGGETVQNSSHLSSKRNG